jgi:hypothetical protein
MERLGSLVPKDSPAGSGYGKLTEIQFCPDHLICEVLTLGKLESLGGMDTGPAPEGETLIGASKIVVEVEHRVLGGPGRYHRFEEVPGHGGGGGDVHNDVSTLQGQDGGKFGEEHIIADLESDLPEGGVEDWGFGPGLEVPLLIEGQEIGEEPLEVPTDESVRSNENGGIVQEIPVIEIGCPKNDVLPGLGGDPLQPGDLDPLSANGHPWQLVLQKVSGEKELREHDEIGILGQGDLLNTFEIRGFVTDLRGGLNQCHRDWILRIHGGNVVVIGNMVFR